MTTSITFDTFLRTGASLPKWHPLAKSCMSQSKILRLMNMKMNTRGFIKPDDKRATTVCGNSLEKDVNHPPRFAFRVGIIGGGVSGLACAEELLRLAKRFEKDLDLEVVILEARDRLGGRICTDYETFKDDEGNSFPVDLGASWIHGKDLNPLAAEARGQNMSLIATSEKGKLIDGPMTVVDDILDQKIEKLFNEFLDSAVSGWNKCFPCGVNSMIHQFFSDRQSTYGAKIFGIWLIDSKTLIDGTLPLIERTQERVGLTSLHIDFPPIFQWILHLAALRILAI